MVVGFYKSNIAFRNAIFIIERGYPSLVFRYEKLPNNLNILVGGAYNMRAPPTINT